MRLLWAEIVMPHLVLESPLSGLPLKHIYYVFLSYIVHRNWMSDKMLGLMISYGFCFHNIQALLLQVSLFGFAGNFFP